MNFKELKKYSEDCQMASDEMAYKYITESEEILNLSILQSHCDFNLFWLTSISPILIYSDTINFLIKNNIYIKRKFSIRELMDFDTKYRTLIRYYSIETINDFKIALKNYQQNDKI